MRLSYAQEQVWLHAQMAPDVPLYNEPVTIHYFDPLNVAALEKSFNEVLRRHEAWRTCFRVVEGEPVQHIQPSIKLSLPVIDLRALPKDEREIEALRVATEDATKPLDLAQAPLFRARLIRLGDEEHRLYLALSHIIFDGVAIYRVFLPELSTLYEAFDAGKPSPLPEPPVQYADYTAWQRQHLQPEMLSEHVAYWREQLGHDLPSVELPSDRPRPALQTFRGSMYPFALNGSLTAAVRRLSQSEGITLFQTLLASFAALLGRYSGENDIPIGSVTAGRDRPETQALLGYFLNTVVLRANLSEDPSFRELMRRMRDLTLEALEHDCVPFGQLIQELTSTRDLSRNPFFQVMFSLEPPMPDVSPAWRLTQMDVDTGATKYDLYLELDERREGVLARFHYSTDLFDLETMKRMAGHWLTLLEGAANDPGLRVSELPLLTEAEQRQVVEWNDTRAEYSRDRCIQDLFAAQCERTPNAVAILSGERCLTYRELDERSNRLAHYIQEMAGGSKAPVGLCVERSIEMVVGLLAILKAGEAYVPLDPSYPAERLAFMLEDSQVAVLLTQAALAGSLPQNSARQICLDADWEKIVRASAETPLTQAKAEDPAYVIYTSGSTGRPKGVVGTHRATINRLSWMWQEYPFQPREICCQKTSLSFVDSVWEIFGPLLAGVPSTIIPDEDVKNVDLLVETLAANRITRIVLVPSLLRAILSSSGELGKKLPQLKLWVSSGEVLPPDLAQSFLDRMPSHTLLNLYGSTEVAGDATCYEVREEDWPYSVPIGRPIANTQAYVLDARQHLVPSNVQGEIYIGGDAVARGYLNRPALTAEKFVPGPFSGKAEARLYRTGDLGRYLMDGKIEYLGRRDYQVKVRGFRIELGEIEATLGRHPEVGQCVLVAPEDSYGAKRLVAYFEPRGGQEPAAGDIRTYLKGHLPEYMIPSAFVAMEKLPLTPNGKIDRKALPDAGAHRLGNQEEFVAPRDEFEQVLARLWSKVLKVARVSVHDNFFELGGHSLLAVRIMVEIGKVFKRRLPLATLIQAPTVAALADILRRESWTPSWSSLVPMQAGGSKLPLFLMHAHGGNVLEYHPLVNHLEADQPVYALQARGLDGSTNTFDSIEEMAAAYLDEIRSLQPEGPYYLGGFCFGGLVALEAAQQLTAAGEKVALLVLIQTMNPAFARFSPDTSVFRQWWYRAVKRMDLERENLSHRGAGYLRERCIDVADILRARSAIAFDRLIGNGQGPRANASMRYILESLRIEHAKAYTKYAIRPYHGDAVLFRASRQLSGLMIDHSSGWREVVKGNLEVCEVPGHQQNMLAEPNVFRLAQALTARLQTAQQRPVTYDPSLAAAFCG
ncbi:MAG: amino acid adenylation domain-containing protein [Candidatus Sulfotelmatobacter sp.]